MTRDTVANIAALALLLAAAAGFGGVQSDDWTLSTQPSRWIAGGVVGSVYAAACAFAARVRRRAVRALPAPAKGLQAVWFASQTGTAERIAERSAAMLRAAGVAAAARSMQQIGRDDFASSAPLLFVASTTGEGDAPDMAARFVRELLGDSLPLAGVRYGILALGDRDYANFCGFGHRLDAWLRQQGAHPLFDLVEVDDGDAGALRHWQHHLSRLGGAEELPDWSAPAYAAWALVERQHLNPGSAGGPVFHVALVPEHASDLAWQAGDIAEIGPRHSRDAVVEFARLAALDTADEATLRTLESRHLPEPAAVRGVAREAWFDALTPLPHREYSIASTPEDGALWLLVRQLRRPDGSLGLGAGWLTEQAPIGSCIDVRLRANPGFRLPEDDRPLVLIGNGSGMAGLRALLRERITRGHVRNWLLFGERNAALDDFHGEELRAWLAAGHLARAHWAWSRDGGRRMYVQERLRENAAALREWVAAGASIHVCGSLAGMAPGVDAALREVLGDATVDAMRDDGRYRRDVY